MTSNIQDFGNRTNTLLQNASDFDLVHDFGEWLARNPTGLPSPDVYMRFLLQQHRSRMTTMLNKHRSQMTTMQNHGHFEYDTAAYYANIFHGFVWTLPFTLWSNTSKSSILSNLVSICSKTREWECDHGIGHSIFSMQVKRIISPSAASFPLAVSARGITDVMMHNGVTKQTLLQECNIVVFSKVACCLGALHSWEMYHGSGTNADYELHYQICASYLSHFRRQNSVSF